MMKEVAMKAGSARGQTKARHRRSTAHERARYRCFLPDLAGLAGKRRADPMPDSSYYQEIPKTGMGKGCDNGQNRFRFVQAPRASRLFRLSSRQWPSQNAPPTKS